MPNIPSVQIQRSRRSSYGDTPALSLAGGLLLGLFVGILVAAILIGRSSDEDTANARQTGITLLPNQDSESGEDTRSAASTG